MGSTIEGIFGGGDGSSKDIQKLSKAPFEDPTIQRFLPPALRQPTTGPILQRGIREIGELVRNPGRLSPSVAEAILPRLAAESERIAREFGGIRAQQSGAAARGNAPVSIKTALESALDIAQSRAQRDVRRGALIDSEALRREDLQRIFPILDALLQFTSAGRGAAVQGLGAAAQTEQAQQAATLSFIGSLLTGL